MLVEVAKDRATAERNAQIKRMYSKGITQVEIASLIHRTQGRVSQILSNPFSHFIATPVEVD